MKTKKDTWWNQTLAATASVIFVATMIIGISSPILAAVAFEYGVITGSVEGTPLEPVWVRLLAGDDDTSTVDPAILTAGEALAKAGLIIKIVQNQ